MRNMYEELDVCVIAFASEDIIVTSIGGGGGDDIVTPDDEF